MSEAAENAKKWAQEARDIVHNMQLNQSALDSKQLLKALALLANAVDVLAEAKK